MSRRSIAALIALALGIVTIAVLVASSGGGSSHASHGMPGGQTMSGPEMGNVTHRMPNGQAMSDFDMGH